MSSLDRPRRSALYMPASNDRALEKSKSLDADVLIFDLEDAVSPESKTIARNKAIDAVNSGAYGGRELLIRINGLDTEWFAEDLIAVALSKADGVLVLKVSSADDLVKVDNIINKANGPKEFSVWAMMETPKGILSANEIAKASNRLKGYCIGTVDLSKELNCSHPADRFPMLVSMQFVILSAKAHGIHVLDGVHTDLNDQNGFLKACQQARSFGFDGKSLIHPNQIRVANDTFSPSEEEIQHASSVIKTYKDASLEGSGVATLNGKLIEVLHVEQAKKLIKIAEMIKSFKEDKEK